MVSIKDIPSALEAVLFAVAERAVLAQYCGRAAAEGVVSAFDAVLGAVAEAAAVAQTRGHAASEGVAPALDAVHFTVAERTGISQHRHVRPGLNGRGGKEHQDESGQQFFAHECSASFA